MEKFIPYEKLSKKKKRELDLKRRGGWNGLNPVTRMPPNPKAYNRRKAQKWNDDSNLCFLLCGGNMMINSRPEPGGCGLVGLRINSNRSGSE